MEKKVENLLIHLVFTDLEKACNKDAYEDKNDDVDVE